jgi:hypothetical protein
MNGKLRTSIDFNGQAGGNAVNCAAEEKLSQVAGQGDFGS